MNNGKIKICFTLNDKNEFEIEVNKKIHIRTLKRKILDKINLCDKTKCMSIFFSGKDLGNFSSLRLCDAVDLSNANGFIKVKVLLTDAKESKDIKLKYMLECTKHNSENAHFYCLNCSLSFCALCLEDHMNHEFFDKYNYAKDSATIVDDILNNLFCDIEEKLENATPNLIAKEIIRLRDVSVSSSFLQNDNDDLKGLINQLEKVSKEYILKSESEIKDNLRGKIEEFNSKLSKFKKICENNISLIKGKEIDDIIRLDDDYFSTLHTTVLELNKGKEALLKYIEIKNDEYNQEVKNNESFINEISNEIKRIIRKIKGRLEGKTPDNPRKEHDLLLSREKNLETNPNTSIVTTTCENLLTDVYNSGSTSSRGANMNYVMKRKVGSEIIVYNIDTNVIEIRKDIKKDKTKFKKFLQFSVYINVNNVLYISGGKTKEEKCTKSFYSYEPFSNTLKILPLMLRSRCSHSMTFIFGNIYCIGGYNNNTCERFSLRTNQWTMLPSLSTSERQVSSLMFVNEKYLYSIFGFFNTSTNDHDFAERLNVLKSDAWVKIAIKNLCSEDTLNRFNVGIIKLTESEFLAVGGEHIKEEEKDDVLKITFGTEDEIAIEPFNCRLPATSSFIDKEFIRVKNGQFTQFGMKSNNLFFYDVQNNSFTLKEVKEKASSNE